MGFRSLQRSRQRRSTVAGLACTRYVPPAGFGYPLGGLLPPRPCRPYFVPAALMGFTLRSFLLQAGTRRVSAGENPHAVPLVGYPAAEAVGRPNEPRLLGFDPARSPWRPPQDWCGDRWLLPWALLFQGIRATGLRRISPALLPRASQCRARRPNPPAPRSLNRLSPGPAQPANRLSDGATLVEFSHRRDPMRSNRPPDRAYFFTARRVARCRRPPDALRKDGLFLPESLGIALRCRASRDRRAI
jgi:hypothetical protein